MKNFCTLFDTNYLSRGLLMIESLQQHNPESSIYVFAFDSQCYDLLKQLNLKNVEPISLKDFEDADLLKVKPNRTRGEYCWTCTPATILYCLKTYKLDHCTYVDADLYFYNSLKSVEDEIQKANASILITSHRYTPQYDQTKTSGKYCVQFMYFKNNPEGLTALTWWRERCLEWCYARVEDGKFGDQKYLDDWITRFQHVHDLQHLGGGLAPWNIQQYSAKTNLIYKKTNQQIEPLFFHFHAVKLTTSGYCDLGTYELTKDHLDFFYFPYIRMLENKERELSKFTSYQNWKVAPLPLKDLIKRLLKGRLYYFSAKSILKHGPDYKGPHI